MDRGHDTAVQRQRLAALVKRRRRILDLHKVDAARMCDVAYMTYERVETGQIARDHTYRKIENGFRFAPGSCQSVLDGADGIDLADGGRLELDAASTPFPVEALEDEVRRGLQETTLVVTPDLTVSQVSRIGDGVIEHLRRRGLLPPALGDEET